MEGHGRRCHVRFHQPCATYKTSCTVQSRTLSVKVQKSGEVVTFRGKGMYKGRGEFFFLSVA